MKATIHPEYVAATVSCACGNTWQTRATRPQLRVESCNLCNPLFLGEERIVRAAGSRLERFHRRYGLRPAVN